MKDIAPTTTGGRFTLGKLVATPGALAALDAAGEMALGFFRRHATGDWGDVCPEDARTNDEAIAHEDDPDRRERVFSVYHTTDKIKLYCVTEWDRSATTLLRADEY